MVLLFSVIYQENLKKLIKGKNRAINFISIYTQNCWLLFNLHTKEKNQLTNRLESFTLVINITYLSKNIYLSIISQNPTFALRKLELHCGWKFVPEKQFYRFITRLQLRGTRFSFSSVQLSKVFLKNCLGLFCLPH